MINSLVGIGSREHEMAIMDNDHGRGMRRGDSYHGQYPWMEDEGVDGFFEHGHGLGMRGEITIMDNDHRCNMRGDMAIMGNDHKCGRRGEIGIIDNDHGWGMRGEIAIMGNDHECGMRGLYGHHGQYGMSG